MAKDAGMFKIKEANKTAPMRIIETICLQKVHYFCLRSDKEEPYLVLSKDYHDPAENCDEVHKQIHRVPAKGTTEW